MGGIEFEWCKLVSAKFWSFLHERHLRSLLREQYGVCYITTKISKWIFAKHWAYPDTSKYLFYIFLSFLDFDISLENPAGFSHCVQRDLLEFLFRVLRILRARKFVLIAHRECEMYTLKINGNRPAWQGNICC